MKASLEEQWRRSEKEVFAENYRRQQEYYNAVEMNRESKAKIEKRHADKLNLQRQKSALRMRRVEQVQKRRMEKFEHDREIKRMEMEKKEAMHRLNMDQYRAEKESVDIVSGVVCRQVSPLTLPYNFTT